MKEQNVGENFNEDKLLAYQAEAWKVLDAVSKRVEPGMTEKDGKALLDLELKASGSLKYWHPPQIRFGSNTLLAFGKPADPNIKLLENDIFFYDIGPLFDGYESDAGKTYTIGSDAEMKAIAEDSEKLFKRVQKEWKATGLTGRTLYDFAKAEADRMGWELSFGGASGHRIADFPHALHYRGSLKAFDKVPSSNRWILEIHLKHKTRKFGAFFEDIM